MSPLRIGVVLALAAGIATLQAAPALAATIAVNATTDEAVADSHCSLREAINAANADSKGFGGDCAKGSGADTVRLPRGHFTLLIGGAFEDDDASGDLDVRSTLTIAGPGAAATTIDAAGLDRVLHVLPGRIATIRGVTVTGGHAPDGADGSPGTGSGLVGDPGEPGGGIVNEGNLTLVDSVVTGNATGTGGRGGAGHGLDGSSPVSGDGGKGGFGFGGAGGDGGAGGGIFTTGSLTVTRTAVTANSTGPGGAGGIGTGGNGGASPDGNGGAGGDGVSGRGGSGGAGGGIAERAGGTVTVDQSTVAGNHAGAAGAGGAGQGGAGGGTGAASGSGGAGGHGSGSIGTSGATGGGIQAADPVVVTRSLISGNVSGSGGATGDATGGPGGPTTGGSAHSGDGGGASAGIAGDGGFGGGLGVPAGSTVVNDTLDGNSTGVGGDLGSATGGKGGNAINVGGDGGDANGGIVGSGGNGAGLWTPAGNWTIRHATITSNALGGAGAIGALAGGAVGTGGSGSGSPGSTFPGIPGSPGRGGAAFNSSFGNVPPLTIANTIVADNGGPACDSFFPGLFVGSRNISPGDASCGGADVDPKLGPLAANGGPTKTRALGAGSPALNVVPARGAGCPPTDQRGARRPGGPACDVGAYEIARPGTKITKARIRSKARRARFRFTASGLATGFECRLKRGQRTPQFKRCRSPKEFKGLAPAKYTFEVRALGPDGPDRSPAKRRFEIG